tara:strand:+ start:247 stop:945 length:699 start_codon:yes stop_codon:yes gene_type:complete
MQNLTNNKKYDRAKQKEVERNFKKQKKREAILSLKVDRKVLSVSIKKEAFEKLELLAKRGKTSNWEMLSQILLLIPQRKSSREIRGIKTKRYKASTGNKQLNYRINSTAWYKLEDLSKADGKSKARLVQELIMNHELISEENLEKKEREKTEKEKQINYYSKKLTKKLYISSENMIVHKKGIPISKWNNDEYEQLQYLTKIQIKMFKEMQRKEREDAEQDISEPPDWFLEQL